MTDVLRDIVSKHAGIAGGMPNDDDADLYRAGMKSFSSVQLMLALEEAFDVEFPEEMLTRTTFRSVSSIRDALRNLALLGVAG